MNTVITSREAILAASRELIAQQGWAAFSMRSAAAACGVAVGSLYHYFPSKADLAAAVVESIWRELLQPAQDLARDGGFLKLLEALFQSLEEGSRRYPGFFRLHSMGFSGSEKDRGRQRMEQTLQQVRQAFCAALEQDPTIRPDAFGEGFTPAEFGALVFSLVQDSMFKGTPSREMIFGLVRRCVY